MNMNLCQFERIEIQWKNYLMLVVSESTITLLLHTFITHTATQLKTILFIISMYERSMKYLVLLVQVHNVLC